MKCLGLAVAGFARDDDLVDVLAVEVADGALDERAFLVDEGRRARSERRLAHGLPHAQEIFEVALDLGLGARGAGRAQDDAHALGHVEFLGDALEPAAVLRVGDLARDAAAARGVRHQHRIPAGEREIGRERRALVAALLLHDLHEQHLTALDDFLNLVVPAQPLRAARRLVHGVAADLLDRLAFAFVIAPVAVRRDALFRAAVERRHLGRGRHRRRACSSAAGLDAARASFGSAAASGSCAACSASIAAGSGST